jgi:thiol:disulfide interchange protein DsbD
MQRPSRSLLAIGCLVFAALSAAAPALAGSQRGETALDGEHPRIAAELLIDRTGPHTARVGVLFEPDPGWHLYWRHPGDTGLAPQLRWRETRVGDIAWPVPQRYDEGDLVTYGYGEAVLLAAQASFGTDGPAPERIGVDVDVLVCRELCIPGSLSLDASLPAERRSSNARDLFDHWARRVPVQAAKLGVDARGRVSVVGDALRIAVDVSPCRDANAPCGLGPPAADQPPFFPYASDAFDLRPASRSSGDAPAGHFAFTLDAWPEAPGQEPTQTLHGVLLLDHETAGPRAVEIAIPLEPFDPDASLAATGPATPQDTALGLLRAALLAFLGGLILNLMPCVLPVLALKVFALAELASRSRREVHRNVAAYTGGILAAMGALGLFVIGLRAAGSAVGWGFHLQEPVFLVAVSALLVAFAANLFGVFEIQVDTSSMAGIGADRSGAARSFFDGLLAVVLATPCSAPFLGTAVGFAFASPAPIVLAIFGAVGLGLAAPFAAVAAVPGIARHMPRSGPWMLHLRSLLGFALLATVVWLLWVLGRAAGPDATASGMALLVAVAFAAWLFGLWQRGGRALPAPLLIGALAAVIVGGSNAIDASARPEAAASQAARDWSADAVRDELAAGRAAFVYFTADWCLTCKLNERRVLDRPLVRTALADHGVTLFRADWTRRDETIRAALADLGRAGVPVYALYAPDAPDAPRVLPELLSVETVVDAVAEAGDAARRHAASARPTVASVTALTIRTP